LRPSTTEHTLWIFQAAPGAAFESTDRTGKWCVYRTGQCIDQAWRTVRALVSNGVLLAAKVSTRRAVVVGGHEQHVICIYTADWEDLREVWRAREVLRAAGFSERLGYKRDADTAVGAEAFVYEA